MKVSFYKTLCLLARPQNALPPRIPPVMKFIPVSKNKRMNGRRKRTMVVVYSAAEGIAPPFALSSLLLRLHLARAKFSLPFQVQLTTPVPAAGPHGTRVPFSPETGRLCGGWEGGRGSVEGGGKVSLSCSTPVPRGNKRAGQRTPCLRHNAHPHSLLHVTPSLSQGSTKQGRAFVGLGRAQAIMDVDTEELRQIYDALSVRELKEELTSRGLQTEGVRTMDVYSSLCCPFSSKHRHRNLFYSSFPILNLSVLCLPPSFSSSSPSFLLPASTPSPPHTSHFLPLNHSTIFFPNPRRPWKNETSSISSCGQTITFPPFPPPPPPPPP